MISALATSGSHPLSQAFYFTPTAQPDGRILYTVNEGENCQSIAIKNGIDEGQLRALNNLQGDDCLYLQIGQQLLIGVLEEPTATSEQEVTPEPSPTPIKGNGTICIYLFNDENGNAMPEETERDKKCRHLILLIFMSTCGEDGVLARRELEGYDAGILMRSEEGCRIST